MSQVLDTELLLLKPVVNFGFELFEGLAKLGVDRWGVGHELRQRRSEQAGVNAGEEQRYPQSRFGHPIAVSAREAFDHPVQAEPPQIVADSAGRHGCRWFSTQRGQFSTEVASGKNRSAGDETSLRRSIAPAPEDPSSVGRESVGR